MESIRMGEYSDIPRQHKPIHSGKADKIRCTYCCHNSETPEKFGCVLQSDLPNQLPVLCTYEEECTMRDELSCGFVTIELRKRNSLWK